MHGGITFLWVNAIVHETLAYLTNTARFFAQLYFVDKDKTWSCVTLQNSVRFYIIEILFD